MLLVRSRSFRFAIWCSLRCALPLRSPILSAPSLPTSVVSIQEELPIADEPMGWALSAFFITYAVFQIPGGWLTDRWGSRRALVASVLVCSVGTAATAMASGVTV